MIVETSRFGPIEVEESDIITFPMGIPGFEECRRFILIRHDPEGKFLWLQSADEPDLALVTIEPHRVFKDYAPEIPEREVEELAAGHPGALRMLAIVTIPGDVSKATVNLAAPIVLNEQLRRAKQVVLEGSPYSIRQRLFGQNGKQTGMGDAKTKDACG